RLTMNGKQAVSAAGFGVEAQPPADKAVMPEATSHKNFAVGSTIYLFSNILNALVPFALLPILTRYLTPAEYGEVAMFQTWIAALAACTGLSVQGAAERKFYDIGLTEQELRCFIGACLQVLLLSTAWSFCVVFLLRRRRSLQLGMQ